MIKPDEPQTIPWFNLFRSCRMLLAASTVLSLCLALLVDAITKNEARIESEFVTSLSDKTYDQFLKENKHALIEFYAPWCGHCKSLAPAFSEAAEKLIKEGVKLAQVDCTEHQDLCKDIRGFPTLKVFTNGNSSAYNGPRTAPEMVGFMLKQIKDPVSEVAGAEIGRFTQSDKFVFVGDFEAGSEEEKVFTKVADKFRNDFTFGKVAKRPYLALHRNKKGFDEQVKFFEGKFTEEELTEFIQTETVPLMDEIGPENYMKYFESKLPLAYFFYGDEEQRAKYGPEIESAMKDFKGKINAVYIKASQFGQHADSLNLKKKWPGFVVHNMEKDLKYPFDGKEITKDSINKFVAGIAKGEIKPTFKSEPIPEKDDGPVKVLVHDNFDKVVFGGKKDALVEFYAPWCGACKNLAPIYEKLAAKYAKVKNGDSLVIAKMDAVANDMPESLNFELRAYPTIKFFKAGSKEAIDYDGEHDLKSFVDFLNTKCSKLNNVQLDKAEIEEEEARQQKIKEAREKAQKAREGKSDKSAESGEEYSDDHKEL